MGGRGARGTGSPDPSVISNPRVYARVQLVRIMEMLAWLESSALARWVVESESLLALPTVLTLHTMGLAILVGPAWVLDLRLLGLWRQIPLAAMRVLYRPMWIGLGINTVTGILLFMSQATQRGTSPIFFTKMFFVACGVSTLVLIQRHVYGPTADPENHIVEAQAVSIYRAVSLRVASAPL